MVAPEAEVEPGNNTGRDPGKEPEKSSGRNRKKEVRPPEVFVIQ